MESIYKPWQWPIPITSLLLLAIGSIVFLYGISMLIYKPDNLVLKEIVKKVGHVLFGIIVCLFSSFIIFLGSKWFVQSSGKAVVAIVGNHDTVVGYAENINMGFSRDGFYSGSFSVGETCFNINSGGKINGTAYINGEQKAELFNNCPIVVKYKRILGMNIIISIDAITEKIEEAPIF